MERTDNVTEDRIQLLREGFSSFRGDCFYRRDQVSTPDGSTGEIPGAGTDLIFKIMIRRRAIADPSTMALLPEARLSLDISYLYLLSF